jgi:hypothetical protein
MTVTITGYTAEKMQEIIDDTVSGAHIDGDDLILDLTGGGEINAGDVRGPIGPAGIGAIACISSARPILGEEDGGQRIYELDTGHEYLWDGYQYKGYPSGSLGKITKATTTQVTTGWATAINFEIVVTATRTIELASFVKMTQVTNDAVGLTQCQLSIDGGDFQQFGQVYNFGVNQDRNFHTAFETELTAGTYDVLLEIMGAGEGALRALAGSWASARDVGCPNFTP